MTANCPTCGRRSGHPASHPHWTRERIAAAIVEWFDRNGVLPTMADWEHGAWWHPSNRTVRRRFPSWNAAIAFAGYEPRPARRAGVTAEEAA